MAPARRDRGTSTAGPPSLGDDDRPAVGEPELGPAVAVVLHERHPFAAGHGPIGEGERAQVHRVAGELVVEAEALPAVPDFGHAALVLDPPGLGRGAVTRRRRRRM